MPCGDFSFKFLECNIVTEWLIGASPGFSGLLQRLVAAFPPFGRNRMEAVTCGIDNKAFGMICLGGFVKSFLCVAANNVCVFNATSQEFVGIYVYIYMYTQIYLYI